MQQASVMKRPFSAPRQAEGKPLRFGWSQASPPQYDLPLTSSDLGPGLEPQPSLLHKIAQKLIRREDLNRAGFARFPNLDEWVPAPQQAAFLDLLIQRLGRYLQAHYKADLNPSGIRLTTIRKTLRDGQVAAEGNLTQQDADGRWTLKSPHFDRKALVVLHRYRPPQNVQGGAFQVIDVKQYLSDQAQEESPESLQQMIDAEQKILPTFWEALRPYTLTLEKEATQGGTIIFNNTLQAGVAHAVTPVRVKDPSNPFLREYTRYTLTPQEPKPETLPP